MKHLGNVSLLLVGALLLQGCAGTALSTEGQGVRIISADEAKKCKFVDTVSSNNQHTLVGEPEEDARNQARNRVASLGGNALHIKSTNNQIAPSGVGSIFTLNGEAYSCR
ncbi:MULTISPECIES: DUF4156 domain-containing protein [unclassified Pseudomonas]|uniref:DUF4156 domain-containing protein n=1 Tax=unclassified Pseudomonas TaxID=196821 RepID=UPI0024497B6A|nr:DUF4156 domain-containing protein [Pseudomonas sp. GD03944]MDH1264263.1 DUF4156 domain-containing protein [Pseudomonas sp. GD03944]